MVGNQLGTGVFTLPASLAPYGWNAVLGWGATIAGALALAHVFGRLSVKVPGSGGPHAYTRAAFGEGAGFVVAWSYWMNQWVGNAGIGVAVVGYLAVFAPVLGVDRVAATLVSIGCVWAFTLVNLLGVGAAGRVAVVTTVLKLVPMLGAVGLAAWVLARHGVGMLTPAHVPLSGGATAASATLTVWAIMGLESATVPSGKVHDPARTIPRATLWGTGFAGAVSLVLASGVMLLLPPGEAARSAAPIADFARRWAGGDWAAPIAAFAVVSGLGTLSGWVLIQGEMPAAMARAGVFPRALARADARGTPWVAHLVASTMLTGVLLMNASDNLVGLFGFIVQVSGLAVLVAYAACALAAVRLRAGGPGFVGVALFAAGYALWALTGADAKSLEWFGGLMAAGLPVYAFMRWRGGGATSPARAAAAAAPRG